MEHVDDRRSIFPSGHAAGPDRPMRLLPVMWLAAPVWAYGCFWDLSVARYYGSLGSWSVEDPSGAGAYLLQHAILLPGFALTYYVAARIFMDGGRYARTIAKQALLLLVFVSLVRPDLLLMQRLVGREPVGGFLAQLDQRHAWFHTAVSYSLIYLVGLCALFALSMALRHREQGGRVAPSRSDLPQDKEPGRLMIKVGRTVRFVEMAAIESIETDGDYLNIQGVSGERSRTRQSLTSIVALLPGQKFTRIHRSTLVNLDRVRELRSDKHGGYILVMTSGRLLATGAKYATNVKRLLRTQVR